MIDLRDILIKAGNLFKKFGIKSITMDDVAHETGMSKKTLYQFVTDKSELIERVVKSDLTHFKDEISKLDKLNFDPVLEIIELDKFIFRFMVGLNPSIEYDLKKYYLEIYNKSKQDFIHLFIETLKTNIEKGKDEKVYRADIDPMIMAKLHVLQVEQFLKSKLFPPEEYNSQAIAREICLFHINGLITKKGQCLLAKHMKEIKQK